MATRAQRIKVGVFLIASAATMVGILALVAQLTNVQYVEYSVVFDNSVLGLSSNSDVVYLGVPVGKVQEIHVTDEGWAHVTIAIEPDKVTLRDGVTAKLEIVSFALGTMAIALQGGDGDALPEGSVIPTETSIIQAVSTQITTLMGDINKIIDKINKGLEGVEEGDLARVIDDADLLLKDGRDLVNSLDAKVDSLTARAESTFDSVDSVADEVVDAAKRFGGASQSFKDTIEPLDLEEFQGRFAEELDRLGKNIDAAVQTMNETAKTLAHRTDNVEYTLRETLQGINESLAAIKGLADYLREDPSALIRGKGIPKEDRR